MRVHVYSQHCTRAGQLCVNEELIEGPGDDVWTLSGSRQYFRYLALDFYARTAADGGFAYRVALAIWEELYPALPYSELAPSLEKAYTRRQRAVAAKGALT